MFAFEVLNTDIYGTVTTLGWLTPVTAPRWSERYNSIGGVTFDITYAQFKQFFLTGDPRWIYIKLRMRYLASTYNPVISLYPMKAVVDNDTGRVTITLAFSTIIATYKRVSKNENLSNYPHLILGDRLATLEGTVSDPTVYSAVSRRPWDLDYNTVLGSTAPLRAITGGETVFDFISRLAQSFRLIFGFGWNTCSPNQSLANAYALEALRRTRWGVQGVSIASSWLTWKRQYQALNIKTSGFNTEVLSGVMCGNDAMLTSLFTQTFDFTRLAHTISVETEGPVAGGPMDYYTNNATIGVVATGKTKADHGSVQAYWGQVYAGGAGPFAFGAVSGLHTAYEYPDVGTALNQEQYGYLIRMLTADNGYHYANMSTTMASRQQHSHLRRELMVRIPEVTLDSLSNADVTNYINAVGNVAKKILESHSVLGGQTEVTLKDVILPFWGTQYDWVNDVAVSAQIGGTPTSSRRYVTPNLFIGRMANLSYILPDGSSQSTWGWVTGYEYEYVENGMIKANITLSQNPYSSQFETEILADTTRRVNRR